MAGLIDNITNSAKLKFDLELSSAKIKVQFASRLESVVVQCTQVECGPIHCSHLLYSYIYCSQIDCSPADSYADTI